jgi:hypothetical protein
MCYWPEREGNTGPPVMTGNPGVMDQVGRRCPAGGNAVRRLFCIPLECSTASTSQPAEAANGGGHMGDKNYVFAVN